MQEDRAVVLRRKIAVLRGYLRDGVEAEIALMHLRAIAEAESELRAIASRGQSPPSSDRPAPRN